MKVWDINAFYLRAQLELPEVLTELAYINVENIGGLALLVAGDAKGNIYWNKVRVRKLNYKLKNY